ncbi:hypothetical protein [Actinomadura rupiterrae]|uniref:hypothetical protein n=1 Tax=Actinomadura rupiterrae TaxID=559627 RepID=UPI0020A3F163|nr:hypothetical protein [Actinomadura rupiterrae]MCP2336584.1 hypothetical protein [Actinomadura rupiterrae]
MTITVDASKATAVFRPTRPGFHLYSSDLPPDGVQGLGVPTRFLVGGGLAATARPTADKAVRPLLLRELNVTLRVYPDGPVTFTLPVRRSGHSGTATVSYGACSATTCMAPVTDHITRFTY